MTNVDRLGNGFGLWLAGLLSRGGSNIFFSDGQLMAGGGVERRREKIRFGSEAQGVRTMVQVDQIMVAQFDEQGIRFSITSQAVGPTGSVVEAGVSNQKGKVQSKKK